MKTKAEVLADPDAFYRALARAEAAWRVFDGVLGVGFGQKQVAGEYHDVIAIVVYVREKKGVPPAERIPPEFEGYPTDVRVAPRGRPGVCDNGAKYDTIQGGIQICRNPNAAGLLEEGTLACIVRKRSDSGRDNVYLLTNKHVLFENLVSGPGDDVYHPYPPQDARGGKSLGKIQPQAAFSNELVEMPDPAHPGQFILQPFFLDYAIARLDLDCTCWCCVCSTQDYAAESVIDLQVNGVNTISDVNDIRTGPPAMAIVGQSVFKVGRTTGRTAGIVRGVAAAMPIPAWPPLGTPPFTAERLIEIDFDPSSTSTHTNCHGNTWFAQQGDSGSLIVDQQGRAVGIVSIVPAPGAPQATSVGGCHIVPILDRLGICIPTTTGTSHGSTRATDGSGVAPWATTPAASTLPSGQIVFSDADTRRVRAHAEAFRATPRGAELHAVVEELHPEVASLVRHSRRVKVAWHRHQGPAFLALVLDHLAGHAGGVPHAVAGVTREALLLRMRAALNADGSPALRAALDRHGDEVLAMATSCGCVADCLAWLARAGT
jgi:hypothetical protein